MKYKIRSINYSTENTNKAHHYHDCHQLIYVKKGMIRITVGQSTYEVADRSLIMISRYEEHSVTILSETYERYTLLIESESELEGDEESVYFGALLTNRPSAFRHAIRLGEAADEIDRTIGQLYREFVHRPDFSDLLMNSLLRQLFIYALRESNIPRTYFESDRYSTVEKVKEDLEKNFAKLFSLSELAEKYHISPSYLSHVFKRITGFSVMNYLLLCRIAAAKVKLTTTNLTVSQIVEQCGFSDFSNFSRNFKAHVGMTPKEFRKTFELR